MGPLPDWFRGWKLFFQKELREVRRRVVRGAGGGGGEGEVEV